MPDRESQDAYESSLPSRSHPAGLPSLVVGMGASAGGLEAFEEFFDRMPPDNGLAFVIIQHLAPDRKSLMTELLARHTQMPVKQVQDQTAVEPNHVYIIPPKTILTIESGVLHAAAPAGLTAQRAPI